MQYRNTALIATFSCSKINPSSLTCLPQSVCTHLCVRFKCLFIYADIACIDGKFHGAKVPGFYNWNFSTRKRIGLGAKSLDTSQKHVVLNDFTVFHRISPTPAVPQTLPAISKHRLSPYIAYYRNVSKLYSSRFQCRREMFLKSINSFTMK